MSSTISFTLICKEDKKPMVIKGNYMLKVGECKYCKKKVKLDNLDAEIINGLMMI